MGADDFLAAASELKTVYLLTEHVFFRSTYAYTDRMAIDHVSSLVSYDKIVAEKYNLSVSTYVEKEDTREKIDIVALNDSIKGIVENVNQLRAEVDKIVNDLEGGE